MTTEIPQNYKQTSIGITSGWVLTEFSNLVTLSKKKYTPKSNEVLPCIELEHFNQETGSINGWTNSNFQKSTKNVFEKGDVLFGKLRPYLRKFWLADFDGVCSSEVWVLKSKEGILPDFLYRIIQSNRFIQIANVSSGSKMPRADWDYVSEFPFPIPPLLQQQKIAEILSTWDTAIETCQKTIEQLKQRNKGLAQQLLSGKNRLGNFNGHWHFFKLKDIAKRVTAKNEELNDTVVTISAQRGFVLQEDYFSKRVASATLSHYTLLRKGQFAYNKSYSKGYPMGAFKRLDDFEKAVVTTLYICFEIKENVNSDFINFYFEHGFMINGIMQIAQEGARAHGLLNIALEDFFNLDVKIPVLEEQKAIVDILNNASNELRLYQEKLNHLQQQKKGLMQQLLTGKVRTVNL